MSGAGVVGSREPTVTINGQPLDLGQAMALRVAATAFLDAVTEEGELRDSLGPIGALYADRLREVVSLMLAGMEGGLP